MERWSEWSKAVALKAIEGKLSGGSNPSLSVSSLQCRELFLYYDKEKDSSNQHAAVQIQEDLQIGLPAHGCDPLNCFRIIVGEE